ncbi:integrase, catalytic region, zinc finger, CCHC-type containing protein [Tanacetum coccineum]
MNKMIFFLADAAQMEEFEELSANICMMARIQPSIINSDEGPNYDSAFISEVQTPSTSYMNPLFMDNIHEQIYHEQPKIINSTISDDQIYSDIIFDDPNMEVNSGSFEHNKNVHNSYKLEQLAKNAYKEAEKQQIIANKVKQQNVELAKQLEQYKERVQLNANADKYLDDVLNLEAKLKKNENVVIKISQSVQELFMLGPKPLSFYEPRLKHGLGYENPYTLKKEISQNPKLYDASCLHSSKVHVNVCDTEKILEDATKSQIKMENKLKDPIAIEKKQNFCSIDYKKLNALYKTFVPRVELSVEQKYFSYVSTTSETSSNASTSSSPPATMPNSSKLMKHFQKMETEFEKLFTHLEINSTPKKEVKTMMDVFESMESDLDATWKQNKILNDQLLKATLKHDVEKCVLMCNDFVNDNSLDEIENVKRESIDIQENLLKQINILENNFQRCQKQCIDYELQLQHQNEKNNCESSLKNLCETSWISKMEKLENENVSLAFQVQSLVKECENIKLEYQKLFNSIKKTRIQTQGEINELIKNVNQKTYAYEDVQVKNQDLLITISELKAKLKYAEIGARESNSYTISISDMVASSPVYLMSKATSTKSWLWHRRLSHMNFGTINDLTQQDLVDGLLKFKYDKDHLFSACERGKSKKATHLPKLVPSTHSKLDLIHVDLCRPMSVRKVITGTTRLRMNFFEEENQNVEYFHVFRSLCYPTNDQEDLGKMKPKVDIGIFISYSESSRGFQIYNRITRKIMETIHVKFDELTTMAFEHNFLEPGTNRFHDNDSSAEDTPISTNEDLDNLFDTPSSSSIIVEDNEAPLLVSSCEEQISLISNDEVNELIQEEDSVDLDRNMLFSPYHTLMFEEAESSSTAEDLSKFQVTTPVQPSTHVWTKAHPLDQVISDPSRPVMIRGVYVCVYVDYVGVGTQSIERDHLIGIGVVLDNSFRSLLSDGEMIIEI